MKTSAFVAVSLFLLPSFAVSLDVLVKTGMAPGRDPLVSVEFDLKGPVKVVDAAGREVPCAVRTDPSGRRFVAWRILGAKMLELMDYRIVESAGPQTDLADVPAVLPGMNLIANADFSGRDANGGIADWAPSPRGFGIKDKWDAKWRDAIRAKDGGLELRGEYACAVTYVRGLEEGHVYRLSYDGLCREGHLAATMWFQGDKGLIPNDFVPGVGNYKLSTAVSTTGKWEHVEDSSFVYYDDRTKRMNMNCRGLLPGTRSAYFYFYVEKGEGCVRNLRFEDITSDSGVRADVVREGRSRE